MAKRSEQERRDRAGIGRVAVNELELRETAAGVVMRVRVQPGARCNAVRGVVQGALKVSVTAAPEKGQANRAVVLLLATHLRIRKHQVTFVSGRTSHDKSIELTGGTHAELRRLLNESLQGPK